MDKPWQNEAVDRMSETRRRFLTQVVTTGAVAGAAAALPASAQEKTERTWSTLGTDQVPVAETLARYATSLKYDDLPPEVARTAKRTILDTLGCAIGGYTAGPSQIAVKLAGGVSAKQASRLFDWDDEQTERTTLRLETKRGLARVDGMLVLPELVR